MEPRPPRLLRDFVLQCNSNDPEVLRHIPLDLRDSQASNPLPSTEEYSKTLGIQWNSTSDQFRLTISDPLPLSHVTKHQLVSDVAKTFDILGWFPPTIVKMKILLQKVWEPKVDWDDEVPTPISEVWCQWRSELHLLSRKLIPRCYFP